MNTDSSIRYRLFAHNANDLLIIEIIGQPYYLIKKPQDILTQPQILNGFSTHDIALIGYIAGMFNERRC